MRRGYSKNQIMGMNFPMTDYDFPAGEGSFTGTLVMKKWSDSRGLICYFDAAGGGKYKICVWYRPGNDRTYRPEKSDVDISEIEIGTKLMVSYRTSKTGKTVWVDTAVMYSRE